MSFNNNVSFEHVTCRMNFIGRIKNVFLPPLKRTKYRSNAFYLNNLCGHVISITINICIQLGWNGSCHYKHSKFHLSVDGANDKTYSIYFRNTLDAVDEEDITRYHGGFNVDA